LLSVGFLIPDANWATILLMLGLAAQTGYFGPAFAILHGNVDPRMRGTAIAIVLLATNLIGYGLGPPVVGAASDALGRLLAARAPSLLSVCAAGSWLEQACRSPAAGGLQWALTLLGVVNLWAFYHFLRVSRHHSAAGDSRPASLEISADSRA
jgi:hypothetical protein